MVSSTELFDHFYTIKIKTVCDFFISDDITLIVFVFVTDDDVCFDGLVLVFDLLWSVCMFLLCRNYSWVHCFKDSLGKRFLFPILGFRGFWVLVFS